MSKYIDAEKLIAEIERLYEIAREASYNGEIEGEMTAYDKILSFIASLQQEQAEVELEKAARYVYESWMGGTMDDVRRDMVELGRILNARKEE